MRTVEHGADEVGEVTLGGRRVPVARPRVRAADGSGELGLGTYRHFADRERSAASSSAAPASTWTP